MATYNTAFGSLPGYNEMLGTTNTTGGGQQNVYGQRAQSQRTSQTAPAPQRTFAQLQQQGIARPAPPSAPTAPQMQQYGGSQQAQQMRQQLQQQLQQFSAAPSRFDTDAFKQIRGAQSANLNAEYQAQQKALNEDLARRGLSASSIGGGRMGDLAGQQARALADLDAQLLQRAAETQAQDRAQLLQSGQSLADLAGSQDLAQFEANRVAQAADFENQLRSAQFGQQQYESYGQQALQAAQAEEAAQQAARQFDLQATGQAGEMALNLQRLLGEQDINQAQLTGVLNGQQTLAGQQFAEQRRQFDLQQALQQQLGVGNLSLEQQRLAFQQSDAVAERNLRDAMQTRELTSQERQQLTEITARRELQTQQLNEEARQFGLTLNEQQASRLQQYNISVQELGLETQKIQNQASQFGQQLTVQQAQNTAQNNLEQARINEAIQSRLTGVSESALERNLRQALQTQQLGSAASESALERQLRQAMLNQTQMYEESQFARNLGQSAERIAIERTSANAQDLLARNQLFMQLAQTLGTLTPAQVAAATQAGTTTVTNPLTSPGSFVGQTVQYGGRSYSWDGSAWKESTQFI